MSAAVRSMDGQQPIRAKPPRAVRIQLAPAEASNDASETTDAEPEATGGHVDGPRSANDGERGAVPVDRETSGGVELDLPGIARAVAVGVYVAGRALLQTARSRPHSAPPLATAEPIALTEQPGASGVLTADQAAEFLGVDRNTVYDYAGRGVIPHQRLGKRILFHRDALVSWLAGCKATSARKG